MNRYLRAIIEISKFVAAPVRAWIPLAATGSRPRLHEIVAEGLIHAGMFALCGLLIVTLGACAKRQKGPPQFPPTAVQTTLAVKMNTPVVISAFGNTEDQVSVDVVPQVSGMLDKTFILDGAIVTNGQPLFLIRDMHLTHDAATCSSLTAWAKTTQRR